MKPEKLILPALGLFFMGMGAALLWFFVSLFSQEAARIESLSPLTAATLAERPAGQESLIEGRISERNPVHFRSFVAYIRYEYQGRDDDGDAKWSEDDRVTPPLLLDLPGGRVQLANDDYGLPGRRVIWQSEPSLTWNSGSGEGTKSYEGFERGNPVLAVGVVVEGATGREFRAEWLYGGTRAGYIGEQRSSAKIARWVGLIFMAVGAIVFSVGVWVWLR
jgi:hypothetical protein